MPRLIPPLGIFDRDLRRAVGNAYRKAYVTSQNGEPHASGLSAAEAAFVKFHPYLPAEVTRETTLMILSAIEAKHPGWLSNNGPKRYPNSNEDAAAEVADLGRKWL